jgi:hypothetical protein
VHANNLALESDREGHREGKALIVGVESGLRKKRRMIYLYHGAWQLTWFGVCHWWQTIFFNKKKKSSQKKHLSNSFCDGAVQPSKHLIYRGL